MFERGLQLSAAHINFLTLFRAAYNHARLKSNKYGITLLKDLRSA